MEISANLSKMCGVEIDYWGYQDPMADRYGFLEIKMLARPDPPHFRQIVTRPDPLVDPTRGQLWVCSSQHCRSACRLAQSTFFIDRNPKLII